MGFPSLTRLEAASNINLLYKHYNANQKKTEWVFGTWAGGRCFFRIDKNDKILYRTIYWFFVKIKLIKTEENDPVYFKALKEASEIKFQKLSQPLHIALYARIKKLEGLRHQAVEDLHAWQKNFQTNHKEIQQREKLRSQAVTDLHSQHHQHKEHLKKHTQSNEELKVENQRLKDEIIKLKNENTELERLAADINHHKIKPKVPIQNQ